MNPERNLIVVQARNILPDFDTDVDAAPGRYEGEEDPTLTAALDCIVTNGEADAAYGSADAGDGHYAVVGNYVLRTDAQGFVSAIKPRDYTPNERLDFTHAYTVALLWSAGSTWPEGHPNDGEELDAHYSIDDFDADSLALMAHDCNDFLNEPMVRYDLTTIIDGDLYGPRGAQWSCAELAGHDFALTRNHHGAGFWDRGLGDAGDRLTEAAQNHGSSNVFPNGDTLLAEDG